MFGCHALPGLVTSMMDVMGAPRRTCQVRSKRARTEDPRHEQKVPSAVVAMDYCKFYIHIEKEIRGKMHQNTYS